MSRKEELTISCPNCGKTSKFRGWRFINVKTNPELKPKVFDGSLFDHVCPYCKSSIEIMTPFFYHNEAENVVLHFATDQSDVTQILDTINKNKDKLPKGLKHRIVFSHEALREKAMIFECGFDDRIIEIIKVLFKMKLEQENESAVEYIYFVLDEGKPQFEISLENDESIYIADISPELYRTDATVFSELVTKYNQVYGYFDYDKDELTKDILNFLQEKNDEN